MLLSSSSWATEKRFFIRISSVFIVVMALVIALYGVSYLTGSPFELSNFVPIRKFTFLTLKGGVAQKLLWRIAFTIHLIGGSIGLVSGSFLFFFKPKTMRTHRIAGTCYAAALLCSSVAGLYLSYFASVSRAGIIGFFITDICWFVSTCLGVQAVCRKDNLNHKKWFLRSFSFALIVVSFRILFQLFFNVFQYSFNLSYVLGIWLSMLLNIIVAELIILRKYQTPVKLPVLAAKRPIKFTSVSELSVTE